jgi:hypothetical protein
MTAATPDPLVAAQQAYDTFPDDFRSVILATVDAEGRPHASYSPFVMDERRRLYCLLSGLAEHTPNLEATGLASVLFLEDEKTAAQVFARRRLTFDCKAAFVPRDDPEHDETARRFVERFGTMGERLLSMPDFRFVRLTPIAGRFVIGFGAAYDIVGEALDRLEHRRAEGRGHGEHGAHGAHAGHTDAESGGGGFDAASIAGIVEHMNADHGEALLGYARVHGGRTDAARARLVSLDARGLDLSIDAGRGDEALRVDFPRRLEHAGQARAMLVQLAAETRARASGARPD